MKISIFERTAAENILIETVDSANIEELTSALGFIERYLSQGKTLLLRQADESRVENIEQVEE